MRRLLAVFSFTAVLALAQNNVPTTIQDTAPLASHQQVNFLFGATQSAYCYGNNGPALTCGTRSATGVNTDGLGLSFYGVQVYDNAGTGNTGRFLESGTDFYIQNLTTNGNVQIQPNGTGISIFSTRAQAPTFASTGTATVAAGTGAGTSPTISVTGTSTSGKITLATGTSTAIGTIATVTFPTAFGAAPNCVVASNVKTITGLGWTPATGTLLINDTTALTASTSGYSISYICIQ